MVAGRLISLPSPISPRLFIAPTGPLGPIRIGQPLFSPAESPLVVPRSRLAPTVDANFIFESGGQARRDQANDFHTASSTVADSSASLSSLIATTAAQPSLVPSARPAAAPTVPARFDTAAWPAVVAPEVQFPTTSFGGRAAAHLSPATFLPTSSLANTLSSSARPPSKIYQSLVGCRLPSSDAALPAATDQLRPGNLQIPTWRKV